MSGSFKIIFQKKLSEETLILAFEASRQIAFFKDLVMHQIRKIFRYPKYAEYIMNFG